MDIANAYLVGFFDTYLSGKPSALLKDEGGEVSGAVAIRLQTPPSEARIPGRADVGALTRLAGR